MTDQAHSTLPREAKGRVAPPPALTGDLKAVADAVAAWPDVETTTHWRFDQPNRVDGVDFYVGADELGHIHLDGSIHLATTPRLRSELIAEGLGRPFVWARGWTLASIDRLGVDGSVALFRRNYDRLRPPDEWSPRRGPGRPHLTHDRVNTDGIKHVIDCTIDYVSS